MGRLEFLELWTWAAESEDFGLIPSAYPSSKAAETRLKGGWGCEMPRGKFSGPLEKWLSDGDRFASRICVFLHLISLTQVTPTCLEPTRVNFGFSMSQRIMCQVL